MIDAEMIKNYLRGAGVFLKETSIESISESINEECRKSMCEQRYNDIITVVMTLSDVGIKEPELYNLLSKFWGIDSRQEATNYINVGRHIEWPYHRLKSYLISKEVIGIELVKYMRNHNVRDILKNNPELCELSVEELKSKIEKM